MVIGGGQRLLLRLSERCNEAPCHGSVRVSYPTCIMHESFRLGTYEATSVLEATKATKKRTSTTIAFFILCKYTSDEAFQRFQQPPPADNSLARSRIYCLLRLKVLLFVCWLSSYICLLIFSCLECSTRRLHPLSNQS